MNSEISSSPMFDYDNTKKSEYFSGARIDWIDQLPNGKNLNILEIGCGQGGTGKYAFSRNTCATYIGVEIAEQAASVAQDHLTNVIVGDVEKIDLPFQPNQFDALLMSEVLEHLIDPWGTLRRLLPFLKPGGWVFASSPNVCHKDIVKQLLRGRWDLTDFGQMDRTHLRWFTPLTFREMFEESGVSVERVEPLNSQRGIKQRLFCTLTFHRYDHLFTYQINLKGRKT